MLLFLLPQNYGLPRHCFAVSRNDRDISPVAQYDNVKKWILGVKPKFRHREPCATLPPSVIASE
ncbi:Uncharacterised protein [Helicobacter canis]|uniref:Uncharacterized protein n=2 Tax=Helicobacter canis TaxID=29419 RepID=A0A377J691_9HELI|nr:Uncharacterised protein [Helicobacter canis]